MVGDLAFSQQGCIGTVFIDNPGVLDFRVIGWSRNAPLIDMAVGKLIPLDECANPVCKKHLPCPNRSTVNGFMVEIIPNEPSLLPGALLYCSEHVFAIVNTERYYPLKKVPIVMLTLRNR